MSDRIELLNKLEESQVRIRGLEFQHQKLRDWHQFRLGEEKKVVAQLRAALATARKGALEECAKAVCGACHNGVAATRLSSGTWMHEARYCSASIIRELQEKSDV